MNKLFIIIIIKYTYIYMPRTHGARGMNIISGFLRNAMKCFQRRRKWSQYNLNAIRGWLEYIIIMEKERIA